MSQSRIAAFKGLLEEQPDDAMIWYGLANEYVKLQQWTEAAEALRNVIRRSPDSTAAYQMLGSALLNLGRADEARGVWAEGIRAAERAGAWNARGHMERLLAQTEGAPKEDAADHTPPEFCSCLMNLRAQEDISKRSGPKPLFSGVPSGLDDADE